MITLRQIRYFVAAVETGKLSSAASECGVSQSAITLALKALEDQLGTQLLDRHASGVTLTYEGHSFLQKARNILAAVAEATHGSTSRPELARGKVRIGITYTVFGYFVAPHLARFQRRFSEIELDIHQLERPQLEEKLQDGELDLAVMLVSNLRQKDHIASQTLVRSPRRLWLPPGHDLLQRKTVSLADIANERYIMLTVDEADKTAMKYWRSAGLKPKIFASTSSVEAVRTLVASGVGISILSDMIYRPWSLEGDRIETRNVDGPVPSMDVGLAWSSDADLSPAAQEFCNFLRMGYARHML